jgi:hypothetical protein
VRLPRETMIELMALADGELEGEARSRAEALVASNAEARAIVDGLRQRHVGAWLRTSFDERSAGAAGIADGVMARIGVPIRAGGSPATPPIAPEAGRVLRPRAWMAAGAVALAAAAAVAVYLRGGSSPGIAPRASDRAEIAESPGGAPASGVEVDEIDAPARGVSVFEIPAAEGAAAAGLAHRPASVVVWIEDPPEGR